MALAGERFRGRAVTREEFEPTFGQSTAADVKSFGLSCTPEELDAFYVARFGDFASKLWVDPQAAELLARLRHRGLRTAVVTNSPTALAENILASAGLRDRIEVVEGADRGRAPKPAADLLQRAIARLGVSSQEAWMIGDSRFDRAAAAAAGTRFVGFGIDGDRRIERLSELEAQVA